jgi:tRNA threonylcarbamoyladenosine biosynthesis protein TsaB
MTRILALDTSTESCSCAIWQDGEVKTLEKRQPRAHAKILLPMINNLLTDTQISLNDLDAIAWGQGPGSFTGLRIAAAVTQGLAISHDLPVLSVSTLAALAHQATRDSGARIVFTSLDARINEIYWAIYDCRQEVPVALIPDSLNAPALLAKEDALQKFLKTLNHPIMAVGDGLNYFEELPSQLTSCFSIIQPGLLPSADSIARLAALDFAQEHSLDVGQIEPVYLRNKVTR